MLSTVVWFMAAGLAPQQVELSLTNVRLTYGVPGITRPEGKVLPGDTVYIAFDIEGISADANGKVLYSMTTEFFDAKGKLLFKQEPKDLEVINALGGKTVPAHVRIDAGLDTPAADYNVKVTVTDGKSKKSQSLTRTVQVAPKGFGLVHLKTTTDPEGELHAATFDVGASLWVNFGVVGFERDKTKGQPDVSVELRVLDGAGKPTLAQPFVGAINEKVAANARALPFQFLLSLNRAGKFTVHVKATDRVSKKTHELSFPVTVTK